MRRNKAKAVALGGVFAALAVVIMCLGGIIPIATYICPMLCAILLAIVFQSCGKRIAWAWYGAVSILVILVGPDKEAAVVFIFLGYYPIIKPRIDGKKGAFIWKLLIFNASIVLMYVLMIYLFRLEQVILDFQGVGIVLTVVTLLLGNVALLMLDILLSRLMGTGKKTK